MQDPPEIERRIPRARLTNKNRDNINEYGLRIPSKNPINYEPELEEGAILLSATGYNYKKQAVLNAKKAWNNYTRKRNEAKAKRNAAKANNNSRKNKGKNNGKNKGKNKGTAKKIEF